MQPSPLNIRQELRQRFVTAGFTELTPTSSNSSPELLFQGEGQSARVIILDETLWADRQAFMGSIMNASTLAGKSNRTYLALPKSAAAVTDARLFHERGIGLFIYDHRKVEEGLPARYFEMTTTTAPSTEKASTDQFENEIRELRAQVDTLERTVQCLSEELMSLKRVRSPVQVPEADPPGRALPYVAAVEDLPAHFAGNPWIEVLSRRGRDGARIAR